MDNNEIVYTYLGLLFEFSTFPSGRFHSSAPHGVSLRKRNLSDNCPYRYVCLFNATQRRFPHYVCIRFTSVRDFFHSLWCTSITVRFNLTYSPLKVNWYRSQLRAIFLEAKCSLIHRIHTALYGDWPEYSILLV